MDGLLFTKISNPLIEDNASMMVVLWDLGPEAPKPPVRPKAPVGKEGDPEYDLSLIEFREQIEGYEAALKAYRQAKIEYADFERRYGGPYEIVMWSCDAHDALERAPKRYRISSKTRGHGRLKNNGLPIGVSPGHGQSEIERRAMEGDADLAALRRADPVFGEQGARP